jgi:signal transduction histidine kinase/ligand-binding sensor domain-containing protein
MSFVERIARGFCIACFSLGCGWALALDPSLDISQYGHTTWRNRDGFLPSTINGIAQTTDGYLWLGTSRGLFRFDGVRSVAWQPPAGMALPTNRIRSLLGARDGTLWIGMRDGLASWKDGKLVTYPAFAERTVNDFLEDDDGTLWIAAQDFPGGRGLVCALARGRERCLGEDGSLGSYIGSLCRDAHGSLWALGLDRVWRIEPQPVVAFKIPGGASGSLHTITATPDGAVLVPTSSGIVSARDDGLQPLQIASRWTPDHRPHRIFRDRDGGLWIDVTEGGLVHEHQGRIDAFGTVQGLAGINVTYMFEDREGSVWVATEGGLDHFRPAAAASYSSEQGLDGRFGSMLASRDGSVWVSTTIGVYRMRDGRTAKFDAPRGGSLFEDRHGRVWIGAMSGFGYAEGDRFVKVPALPTGIIDAIAEDEKGDLWLANRAEGLMQLAADGKLKRIPWNDLGKYGAAQAIAVDPKDGSLWLGFFTGGVVHFSEGRARPLEALQERLPKRRVSQLAIEQDGTLWVSTEAGLARVAGGQVSVLDVNSGLPCDEVYWTLFDENYAWLSAACGLVRIARSDLRAWASAAQGKRDWKIRARLFDNGDGVRALPAPGSFTPKAGLARDGRVWFLTRDGATVVDPAHLPFNRVVPAVHVERVVADRVSYDPAPSLRLPPLPRDIEIDYTATSFVSPQRVAFRYMLEGRDRAWLEAGAMRRAFYTDLPPGNYRFRVIAANDSGVWNEQGDTLAFSIAPAWWQTNGFRASCAAAVALLFYGLYRLRLRQVRREFAVALDARVNERLRIARDLHDTLLQSFHGLLLRLQTALQLWPAEDGRKILSATIDQATAAVSEGRDAVHDLRTSASEQNDLANAIRSLGEGMLADRGLDESLAFLVHVTGATRALHPIVRDEAFRIAVEAVRNAFHHAQGSRIDVELRYDDRAMRLVVRDDGRGIGPETLSAGGREGHFGLNGMRERAKLIGGKLSVWTSEGAGTEVELVIPASQAYANPPAQQRPLFTAEGE